MATHARKQHFVPEFLLSYFADTESNIYYYDKQWMRIEGKGIGGVAFEKDFYDRTPGEKEGSLEYVYQRAETCAAPIIKKIIAENSLRNLTVDEKVSLAMFIVMQLNRTKSALKNTERFQKEFWEPIKNLAAATGAQLDSEPGVAKELWLSSLYDTPRFAEILLQKVWYLAGCNGGFYTSDHPVVKGNNKHREKSQVRGVYGLKSDGIEIYFPLTPSLLICMVCEKSYARPNEEVIQYQAENVMYVNHLQIIESDRFIFAANGDFNLVNEVVGNKR